MPADCITSDTTLLDPGADSFEIVELFMGIEKLAEEFDVSIPDDIAERIQTVGDAIRYIEQRKRGEAGA